MKQKPIAYISGDVLPISDACYQIGISSTPKPPYTTPIYSQNDLELSYVAGMNMARRLLRLQLGLAVPEDSA